VSYAYALCQLYKAAKGDVPRDDFGPVSLWTKIWVSFAVGMLLGFMISETKMNITERISGHVTGYAGCTTIPGDHCK
jgi:hypothetical protein